MKSNEWQDSAADFQRRWNFTHACGALDGKYVVNTKPYKSGSLFRYYKVFFISAPFFDGCGIHMFMDRR